MNETFTPPIEPACAAFEAVTQKVLDGDLPLSALEQAHATVCTECREVAAATRTLMAGLKAQSYPTPPADFADRLIPVVLAARRRHKETRWTLRLAACSLAASALFGFFAAAPWRSGEPPVATRTSVQNPPAEHAPPSVVKSIAEARSAVVSLTKRAATESLSPAKNLFATLDAPPQPTPIATPRENVSSPSPVDPITNTAKRALNLFIRDVSGLSPIHQRKS